MLIHEELPGFSGRVKHINDPLEESDLEAIKKWGNLRVNRHYNPGMMLRPSDNTDR